MAASGKPGFFQTYHGFIAAVLTVVAAAMGILAAYFGVSNNTAQNEQDVLKALLAEKNSQISQRDARIAQLEALVPEGTELPPDPVTPIGPAIRNEGEMTIAGDAIDMNSTEDSWGIGTVEGGTPMTIAVWQFGNLNIQGVDASRIDPGEIADYQTCSTKTTYDSKDIFERDTDIGVPYCLRMDNGRIAAFTFISYNEGNATFNLKTWELA